MPLDLHAPSGDAQASEQISDGLAGLVRDLNARLEGRDAREVIRTALTQITPLRLVSSFGAESVALLHLTAEADRDIPVIFIDTEMLFDETLAYQQEIATTLGLRNLRILRSADAADRDPDGKLHQRDPDACCSLRKTEPLQNALAGSNGWITGRKRFQNGQRAELDFFEVEPGTDRIKVNPLARWSREDVTRYITENRLPQHPLVAQNYPSIGCAPCTTPVAQGEDPRAGRWRNSDKDECGIHFVNGKAVRQGEKT
ncbi:phosphoadenylyl-sulfate reductase [uncultured Roseobacter sp.]|uniref:phosphoadenylyl-sulfate reductase n=1 Tax=uncultured Roseobacter sp. TaxID=114847 RepID=UPI002604FE00|nr:phosphoadenylyl-sulfate reductase [uncultured Roseobacter sp.]